MGRTRAASAPGLKDVAAHAGVSVATVSRVINGGPYVTERVRALVAASMDALGYEPHALARSLRTGETRSVGYVVSDIANALFSTIARGIDDALQPQSYTMVLANSRSDPAHELDVIRHLLRRRVDGLVLSLADETSPALRDFLAGLRTPLVLLDREVEGVLADQVLVDHAAGVAAAVAHLRDLGHTRVGLITGEASTRPGREIRRAFEDAHAAAGAPIPGGFVRVGALSEAFGAQAAAALLQMPEPPTALIAGGAQITVGVLRVLRRQGVRVPEELSLVAYDDTDATELFSPSVSVIARDIYAIGQTAAALLLDRLGSGGAQRVARIPTALILRGSIAAWGGSPGPLLT
jgi:LacI family transcriptional regulator